MRTTTAFLIKRPFLLFLLFLLAAYLPVFLPFFHLKNDLITQNLPTRFVISESLWSGYFPWWNPYINFGIPQYGDMNAGFWNPFLWLIAHTSGYNIWTITLEEMAYILIGGWGIYLLCKDNLGSKTPALVAGISYMTCGFVLGHLQHFCWITGTAFFPYVLVYFIRIQRLPVVKNFILGGWCIFLFVSSTHPGLIIGALYFMLFLVLAIFGLRKDLTSGIYQSSYWKKNLLLLFMGLLFSVVVIVSNLDVLQHISRGSMIPLSDSLRDPTSVPSYFSLLFPLAVQHSDAFFTTDISMRNTYIGIFLFLGFIIFCIYTRKKILLTIGLILLFFILLSSGGIFKTFAYHFIPLTGNVRLNGEFNYFVLLILILAGAAGFNSCLGNPSASERMRGLTGLFSWLFLAAMLTSSGFILFTRHSFIHASPPLFDDLKHRLKWVVDNLSFWDMIFLQSVIHLTTLRLVRKYWTKRNKLVLTIFLHQLILTWCILPYTGLGMASQASRQALISRFPKGIQAPEQKPLAATTYLDSAYSRDLLLLGSYSKKIGYLKEEPYPVQLTATKDYFRDTSLQSFILQQSYVFLSSDTTTKAVTAFDSDHIHISRFGPGLLHASIYNQHYHYLTFLQNDYPWWTASVNGNIVPHFTGFKTFITIPLQQGRQDVLFSFNPSPVKKALLINLIIALVTLLLLCSRRIRNLRLIKPSGPAQHATS